MAKKKNTRKKKTKQKVLDWEGIEREYCANQISIKEIGRRFGCSDTAISKKAKENGWKRTLANRVRARVKEELVRGEVCEEVCGEVCGNNANEKEIVEHAAKRGAEVIRLHRKDVQKMRDMEEKLLGELGDDPTKVHVSQYKGEIYTKTLSLTVSEKAGALQALANVQHKRIQLERQAYNLNDGEEVSDNPLTGLLKSLDSGGLPSNE